MTNFLSTAGAIVAAYLIGSLDFAVIVARRMGIDIYEHGSGNPGTSNVFRTLGKKAAGMVLLGDALKGVLATALGAILINETVGFACALAATLGHAAPIWHRFRGGRGVATAIGGVIWLEPLFGLLLAIAWLVVVLATKTASVASLGAMALYVPLYAVAGQTGWHLVLAALTAGLVIWRHKDNIQRIMNRRGKPGGFVRTLQAAQAAVLDAMALLPTQPATLREARGLVLAEDITAPHDVPPFANSAMDGYAVRAADVSAVPVTLEVVEDVPAGSVPTSPVATGQAIKIMTGAPIPEGADAIVKVEDTDAGSATVEIRAVTVAGTAVRPAGGDIAAGSEVFAAGTRLTAPHLGVLASIGVAFPKIRRRPTVAVLSTGDELVPPDSATLAMGKIRDTNRPTLQAVLEELGAVVVDYGIVPDDAEALNKTLGHAARNGDVVVTSGGVSMGEYDLIKQELASLGTVEFWQVAMQPAKPFAFGSLGGTPLFGLPGNPVSVFVAFEQFLRPALLQMMGATRIFRPRGAAIAGEEIRTDPAKTVFVRAAIARDGDRLVATRSGGQQSNVLTALALADAFVVVPVGQGAVEKGQPVEIEFFRYPEERTREEALGG